jgi:hypothetical protein
MEPSVALGRIACEFSNLFATEFRGGEVSDEQIRSLETLLAAADGPTLDYEAWDCIGSLIDGFIRLSGGKRGDALCSDTEVCDVASQEGRLGIEWFKQSKTLALLRKILLLSKIKGPSGGLGWRYANAIMQGMHFWPFSTYTEEQQLSTPRVSGNLMPHFRFILTEIGKRDGVERYF